MNRPARALLACLPLFLAACGGGSLIKDKDGFPDRDTIPENVTAIPNAVPRTEPRSKYGNPESYEVLGKRYYVLESAEGYRERGGASWYGKKFQGRRTSSGEPYDMFKMTAAHKSLPLPSYVRVTHLGNGRSVVVRVNDRGPFHEGRIIDLSYTAAAKLDMLGTGHAQVEVEAIDPAQPPPPVARFLEVGGDSDPIQAVSVREAVAALGIGPVEIRSTQREDGVWHRVLAGPFSDSASLEQARTHLRNNQYPANPVQE